MENINTMFVLYQDAIILEITMRGSIGKVRDMIYLFRQKRMEERTNG